MALISTISLPSTSEPFVTQTVSLEGQSYVITFDWNSRTDRWTVHLSTEAGQAILNGAILEIGVDLLRTLPKSLSYIPPGQLYLGGTDDPTLDTIGEVSLFYVPSDL